MKSFKIILLVVCSIFLSCTLEEMAGAYNDLENHHYDNQFYFTPPDWIKGSWYSLYINRIEFTDVDVILNSISMNTLLNEIRLGEYQRKLVEEKATDTTYFFSIENYSGGNQKNYLFKKISSDTINSIRSGDDYNDSNYSELFIRSY